MPLYRAVRNRETIANEEWLLRTSQGDLVPVLCNATPITDDEGRVVGGVLIWRDIGDLKASQRALEEAYERERGIAQALQRSHQPRVPEEVGGCRVASSYTPAYSNLLVGGDFFDAFEAQDGRICILIGDVSGKGVAAAALAAVTRSTLRALAFETSCPGQALTRANAAIFPQQEDAASFVTAVVAVLDPMTGRLEFCVAGHPPAALRHASGETEPMGNVGLPLGVLPDQDYACHEAWLAPGDRLLLFTDGLLEARREGEELGIERVQTMWGEEGGRPLQEAIERLVTRASDWAEGKLQDDTALVALEWPGPPAP
jgi:serine phosphatase RsbU (regulator of sigma subunit)